MVSPNNFMLVLGIGLMVFGVVLLALGFDNLNTAINPSLSTEEK